MAVAADEEKFLFKLCCDVGFSLKHWRRRLTLTDLRYLTNRVEIESITNGDLTCVVCGSAGEGLATSFLGSDTDILLLLQRVSVIEDGNELIPAGNETREVFQSKLASHHVFVRLKLHRTEALPTQYNLERFCTVDESGDLMLNCACMKEGVKIFAADLGHEKIIHGPAQTRSVEQNPEKEVDIVVSLHSSHWPSVACEWLSRPRSFNWPSCYLKDVITSKGHELVPVGHPLSSMSDFELRISSSSSEKMLIMSLNIVQVQCYFLLKLTLAFLIKPHMKGVFCSYYMKNVLIHVIENTDPEHWREDNLPACFMTCIQALVHFLEMGFLPQIFIPTQNLLAVKVEGVVRHTLLEMVKGLQSEGWKCLLRCPVFTNIELTGDHRPHRCECYTDMWEYRLLTDDVDLTMNCLASIHNTRCGIVHFCACDEYDYGSALALLQSAKNNAVNICFSYELLLFNHLGYMLLYLTEEENAEKNTNKWEKLRISQEALEQSCDVDMTSGHLKLATFYYEIGKVRQCLRTVTDVLVRYKELGAIPFCADFGKMKYWCNYANTLHDLEHLFDDIPGLLKRTAFPIVFSQWEGMCAPTIIQILMSTRRATTRLDTFNSSVLQIDALVYAYFLLFIAYRDVGKPDAARQSLAMLKKIVQESVRYKLCYAETALQLLVLCECNHVAEW